MPTPTDQKLYDEARDYIFDRYKKNSAFRSGAVVKHYKQMFAKEHPDKEPYIDDHKPKNIKRWFEEKWVDVNPLLGVTSDIAYPVFRPTKKVSSKTPTLYQDINEKELLKQFKLKQQYKGEHNLPTFIPKKGGMIVRSFPERPENKGVIAGKGLPQYFS